MNIRQIVIAFFLLAAGTTVGQNYTSSNKKAIKLFEKGQTALYQSRGDEAVQSFEEALEADPQFIECHIMLAEWFLDTRREAEAKSHYRNAVEINPEFFTLAWLQLGELELKEGNHDQAISDYEMFLKLDKKNIDRHDAAKHGIECAKFRKKELSNPQPFNPQNLGSAINTTNEEYLPALTVDGQTLIFTRRFPRKATTTANTSEEEDFYISTLQDGKWTTAIRMPEPVNSNDNEGAQCISQDGRIMFFTACGRPNGGGRCDIYMCVRRGDKWGKPRNLGPIVNSGAWESQPSFSIDGKTLYFVSDRKGGYGGMDIWKTTFVNGKWTTPENLGPNVNTEGNEMSPFIHYDDQTLYFTSDGHIGMGGMDIFATRREKDGSWAKPQNLGYPINTSGDESNLIVSADARTAIYSSDRQGGYGKQDLYTFQLPVEARPVVTACMKGTITNAKTGEKIAADIKVIELATGNVVANTSSDKTDGQYIVSLPANNNYALHVTADGFLFHSQNENWEQTSTADWQPRQVDIALHPIEAGERIALRNVFFETGRYQLLDNSRTELDKVVELMKNNPSLRIELGGHTDNVGQPADNMKLSQQRAKAVYEYLVSKGIEASRLTFKGYGDTMPVATNDTDEGRATNRRTELKIL